MKHMLIALSIAITIAAHAQTAVDSTYRETPEIINNLVHTKLDVHFDFAKRYLYGKSWITLHPHFYPTDSLSLDAKGMDIGEVALMKKNLKVPLKYYYDKKILRIQLDKTYTKDEQYTIYIAYTAKPDELSNSNGSAAIVSSKGLYFINPDGKDTTKPTEIWTQGETEANSVWFPTIDKTNQKTTSEISITVPDKYVTLSNGRLVSQNKNGDGTRTDNWKMSLPHAPYLFMMAVSNFKIYKDFYHGKEVSYYLEPAYAPFAKQIFGNTKEMIGFYESILGVPYPWDKYSQVVCRDYVSGAMENTTATVHGEYVHRTDRELLDGDPEDFISHELFHQWFGDLVTCENWTNLTLNESFANYSEYLWFEHKYGKDRADELQWNDMRLYFNQADGGADADLVRFHFNSQEDVFDAISYQKGGRILHMLRDYVGDSAFFASLHYYLRQNAFKTAEVPQLRMAFEEITGRDLNWFFNQWYYGKGYPILDIQYKYDATGKQADVTIKQTQPDKIFKLLFAVDVYAGGKKERKMVTMEDKEQTFSFQADDKIDLIDVDANKILLAKKKDSKTIEQLIYQYRHAGTYADRREAISKCVKEQSANENARALLAGAIYDKYPGLRTLTIGALKPDSGYVKADIVAKLVGIAKNDKDPNVRAAALAQLGGLNDKSYEPLFMAACKSRSYTEAGAALAALAEINFDAAYTFAKQNERDARDNLAFSICDIYIKKADPDDILFFKKFLARESGFYKLSPAYYYTGMLIKMNDSALIEKGLNDIRDAVIGFNNPTIVGAVTRYLKTFIDKKKEKAGASPDNVVKETINRQIDYANHVIDEIKIKG